MKIYKYLFLFYCIYFLCACSASKNLQSNKVVIDGTEMLYGAVSRDQLFFDFPLWQNIYDDYEPDMETIKSLSGIESEVDIEIFFGTWCSDSRRELPRFYRILDLSKFTDRNKVKLFAVNRKKKLDSDLTEKRNIQRVATVIFFFEGKEIGRIIENPEVSLEKDILKVIQNH